MVKRLLLAISVVIVGCLVGAPATFAATVPAVHITVGGSGANSTQPSTVVQILVLLTVLTLLPSILIMFTSFTRIVVVLSLLRQAMGTPTIPPNQVLIGLALFLTVFTMGPTLNTINKQAVKPYEAHSISLQTAVGKAQEPIREFMFKQTSESDIELFVNLEHARKPRVRADVSTMVLAPAFVISELKTAFEIGIMLYLPFLVIDMVVASVLMSMGMALLPPIMISLPFKLLLFVLVDGWALVIQSLGQSFFR